MLLHSYSHPTRCKLAFQTAAAAPYIPIGNKKYIYCPLSLSAAARERGRSHYCYSNLSSIEDVKKCINRGGFRQKIEAIEEML
jgi:hypothetical protein